MQKPIAKLVIKDLITGDGAKDELALTLDKIKLFEEKVILKDSIIVNLENKISNFNSIMNTKSDQLALSRELSKKLEIDLKKQKLKNKLTMGAGVVGILAALFLVK